MPLMREDCVRLQELMAKMDPTGLLGERQQRYEVLLKAMQDALVYYPESGIRSLALDAAAEAVATLC